MSIKSYIKKLKGKQDIFELTSKEELILEKNLVWIFADRRSGTTWLGMELLSHNTKFIDEPLIGLHLGRFENLKKGFFQTLEEQKDRNDYFFCEKYKVVWKYFLRKLILNRIHAQFNDLEHKIVIKEPTGSVAADVMASCLPESKVIVIFRDGRDIIDSKLDAFSTGGWGSKRGFVGPAKNKLVWLESRAKEWVAIIRILNRTYKNHPEKNRRLIKYEDLLKNTFTIVKDLYHFIQIEINEKELHKIIDKFSFDKIPEEKKGSGKFRRFAKPGLWKQNFSDEEKKLLESIMGEALKELGY